MSFTKLSLEATKSYIVHVLTQVYLLQNCLWKLPNHILSMSLLKYVFYKSVSGRYHIIYCLVLTQVCFPQNGLWKLPNHILPCPNSSRSFTKWSMEATKSYIVLSFLKYVLYKMVSVSYQIIYCLVLTQVGLLQHGLWKLPNNTLSMSLLMYDFTRWSL